MYFYVAWVGDLCRLHMKSVLKHEQEGITCDDRVGDGRYGWLGIGGNKSISHHVEASSKTLSPEIRVFMKISALLDRKAN
jgi:hypothetical protein